ncbi:hypothetical protein DCCM_2651 [Desulfocucumis palustris]|uniref:Uncharacterized protein n=1 Tax=Desulfocucumis palustris TaxID=1898651 RepID=A0A2L2XB74_9FIRM|nr:hypothetical protein DCCM_2651 [Desulfocucumis palustris]
MTKLNLTMGSLFFAQNIKGNLKKRRMYYHRRLCYILNKCY